MYLLPMNLPAELHRREAAPGSPGSDPLRVASGPLVIMAYGLLSIDAGQRAAYRIVSPLGEMDAGQAETALKQWSSPVGNIAERNILPEKKRRAAGN